MSAYHMPPLGVFRSEKPKEVRVLKEICQTNRNPYQPPLAIDSEGVLYSTGRGSFKIGSVLFIQNATGTSYNNLTVFDEKNNDFKERKTLVDNLNKVLLPGAPSDKLAFQETHPTPLIDNLHVYENILGFRHVLFAGHFVSFNKGKNWEAATFTNTNNFPSTRWWYTGSDAAFLYPITNKGLVDVTRGGGSKYGNYFVGFLGSAIVAVVTSAVGSSFKGLYANNFTTVSDINRINNVDVVCIDPENSGPIIVVSTEAVQVVKTKLTPGSSFSAGNFSTIIKTQAWTDKRNINNIRPAGFIQRPMFPVYRIIKGDNAPKLGSNKNVGQMYSGPILCTNGELYHTSPGHLFPNNDVHPRVEPFSTSFGGSGNYNTTVRYHNGYTTQVEYGTFYLFDSSGDLIQTTPTFQLQEGRNELMIPQFEVRRIIYCKTVKGTSRYVWPINMLHDNGTTLMIFSSSNAVDWKEDPLYLRNPPTTIALNSSVGAVGYNPHTHSLYMDKPNTEKINGKENNWKYGQKDLIIIPLSKWD